MNEVDNGGCYFHPKEVVTGVCHICLNERLLILAAKQGLNKASKSSKYYNSNSSSQRRTLSYSNLYKSKPSISLPSKIFALGSFFNRRDHLGPRHRKSDRCDFNDFVDDPSSTSTSLEDESFISIKFGDNGVASWDKSSSNTVVSKVRLENCSMTWGGQTLVKHRGPACSGSSDNNNNSSRSVVGHAKPRAPLRWRNRIGQILQVIRWNRSTAGSGSSKNKNNNKSNDAVNKVVRSNNKGLIRPPKIIRTKE